MARSKRIFISDFHLNSQQRYQAGDAWFDPNIHQVRLINFLNNEVIAKAKLIKDLILLGDIFDNWVCPVGDVPPTYDAIGKDNAAIIDVLDQVQKKGIGLYYINGNHDFDLTAEQVRAIIPGIRPVRSYLGAGRSHAEHGHLYTLFNVLDYKSDPAFGRPIGYFITRLVTSIEGGGRGIADILHHLDDLLEAVFTPQTLASSIIEALAERAGLQDDSLIEMPRGQQISVRLVKERYRDLGSHYGFWEAAERVSRDLGGLGGAADKLCKKMAYNVVLFGHTHKATIDKDWFLVEDRIYANTGAWCVDHAHCVEVDQTPKTRKVVVRLHSVGGNGQITGTVRKGFD